MVHVLYLCIFPPLSPDPRNGIPLPIGGNPSSLTKLCTFLQSYLTNKDPQHLFPFPYIVFNFLRLFTRLTQAFLPLIVQSSPALLRHDCQCTCPATPLLWPYIKAMNRAQRRKIETVFLFSSSLSIFAQAFAIAPLLAFIYLVFILAYSLGAVKLRQPDPVMFRSPLTVFNLFIFCTLLLTKVSNAQDVTSTTTASAGTPTSYRPIFTVPASADVGEMVIPNIEDPQAKDAQEVCPGYTASSVTRNPLGLTATLTLAGAACNVYGNDIVTLNLTVQYQSADRLAIRITPAVVDASNSSYYDLPTYIVHQPTPDVDANSTSLSSDLSFVWANDPTFSFSVYRVSTGDALFSTVGTKLVFEDQFVEFASTLPENYNLYGLGETIHAFRLGNNFTKTMYATDSGDTIDT